MPRAPAVDQHADRHAALRRAHHCGGHCPPGRIVREDVGLQPDFLLCRADGVSERRKEFGTIAQQLDRVAGREVLHLRFPSAFQRRWRGNENVAASAA